MAPTHSDSTHRTADDGNRDSRRASARYEPREELTGRTQLQADIQLVDLSTTGALLESPRQMSTGTGLTLVIPLDEREVRVRTSVVHSAARALSHGRVVFRVGIRFLHIDREDQDLIKEHIRRRLENERREQPRLYIGKPAQLEKDVRLRVLNLSATGGLFSVHHPLEFDSEHDFSFSLPDGRDVSVRGLVRHCEAWAGPKGAPVFKIGVEFERFYGDGRERVDSFLKRSDETDDRRST